MGNTALLLFGSTGDLAKKKILPALFRLYAKKELVNSPILCIGRRSLTKDQFVAETNLSTLEQSNPSAYHVFLSNLYYLSADLREEYPASFASKIREIDQKYQCEGNAIAYLALSSDLFAQSVDFMIRVKMDMSKVKIAFEKPFGHDLKSAEKLNQTLRKRISEKNIYRVDHYLGKELVDNILVLRKNNSLLSDVWSTSYIDNIQLVFSEDFGIEGRGEYYDKSGAIKDFIQNHALQVLSLATMDMPKMLSAESIRKEKLNVLKNLAIPAENDIVIGQYINYSSEEHIAKDSKTETFVAFKTQVKAPRWRKTPIYIKTGKFLNKKYSEINFILKSKESSRNVISLRIQPEEGIAIKCYVKNPSESKVIPATMEYCHRCVFGTNTAEAYEHILKRIFAEDKSIFLSWEEVRESWKFTDKLVSLAKKAKLHTYAKGSEGPKESQNLLEKYDHKWEYFDRNLTI